MSVQDQHNALLMLSLILEVLC